MKPVAATPGPGLTAGVALCAALLTGHAPAADRGGEWSIFADARPDRVYVGDEMPRRPAPGGLALTVVGGRWRLVPASFDVRLAQPDDESHAQGVSMVATPANALVYLRLPGLKPGEVDTPGLHFRGAPRDLRSAAVPVPFKDRLWRFEPRDNAVWLTDGARRQKIEDFGAPDNVGNSAGIAVRWAGDLDRDGRLDFVIVTSTDDGRSTCVCLSGQARPGELAGKAACVDELN